MPSARGLYGFVCAAVLALGATLIGQAPQIPSAPTGQSPAIDLSGYWTPALHEDLMERGPGAEIADYGGFPLNEAGRLWALSYDPSRVTLRQCAIGRPGTGVTVNSSLYVKSAIVGYSPRPEPRHVPASAANG